MSYCVRAIGPNRKLLWSTSHRCWLDLEILFFFLHSRFHYANEQEVSVSILNIEGDDMWGKKLGSYGNASILSFPVKEVWSQWLLVSVKMWPLCLSEWRRCGLCICLVEWKRCGLCACQSQWRKCGLCASDGVHELYYIAWLLNYIGLIVCLKRSE